MKLLLPSTVAQSRDLALLASPWAEVFPTASTTSLFSSSRDVQAGRLSNHRGLYVLDLEKSLFLSLFGNLCLIPAGEELVYDPWQKRG